MTDTTRRDSFARHLAARICDDRRSLDELRVLDLLLGRLEIGADRYGPLDLSKARDWDKEEAEELLDMRIYQACARLVERDAAFDGPVRPVDMRLKDALVSPDWDMSDIGGQE